MDCHENTLYFLAMTNELHRHCEVQVPHCEVQVPHCEVQIPSLRAELVRRGNLFFQK